MHPAEDRDDQLTILRQRRDKLLADDLAFIKAHGLSDAELATLDHQLRTWRDQVHKTTKAAGRPRLTVVTRRAAR